MYLRRVSGWKREEETQKGFTGATDVLSKQAGRKVIENQGFSVEKALSVSERFQSALQFYGMKPKRTRSALVGDASVTIDQVNSIRPPCVGLFRPIIHTINNGREFQAESSYATQGEIVAFAGVLWAGEDDVLLHIGLHLPDIARMRFKNVNRVERHLPSIFV